MEYIYTGKHQGLSSSQNFKIHTQRSSLHIHWLSSKLNCLWSTSTFTGNSYLPLIIQSNFVLPNQSFSFAKQNSRICLGFTPGKDCFVFFFNIPQIITAVNMIVDQLSIVVPVVSNRTDRILSWSAARAGGQDYRNKESRVKKKILILYPPLFNSFINSSSLQYRPSFLLITIMILSCSPFSLSHCVQITDRALWTSESNESTLRDIYSSQ